MRTVIALAMIVVSIIVLETTRHGVEISHFKVGDTPVTGYAARDDGPVIVIAHGFAGSQQMMQGYALPLAQAGYRVFVFEFLGHGRHTVPMSGDVTSVDGTTRLLVRQTAAVIDAVGDGTPVGLVGHSMATDILVRVAANRADAGPLVLISAFSQVIDPVTPDNMLLISGAWEPRLLDFAQEAVAMVESRAISRRAVTAPWSEHVSVLHSRTGRAEAVTWLDLFYGRASDVTILPSGWAILGVLAGLVLLFRQVAQVVPARDPPLVQLGTRQTGVVLGVPTLLTPLIAVPLNPEVLPVLIAGYLGLHLFIFGVLQLTLLKYWGKPLGAVSWFGVAVLLAWCAVFGFALDRYAANFWPTPERLWIIAVMLLGAVPFMIADATLTAGAGVLRRLAIRLAVLISLGVAIALDVQGLFFLALIMPVLVLFYIVFGTMGRDMSRRVGPMSAGLALGMVLAWALGVSFPLFVT